MPDRESPIRLSVLESTRADGGMSGYVAVQQSAVVAVAADGCGYHRVWVTEHHGQPEIASSAPAVLLAYLATRTTRVRLGAGGVQLVNHAPLVVAEQFRTLEAAYPGRIDLGIGGGPGSPTGSPAFGRALGRASDAGSDYPRRVDELVGFMTGAFPDGHPYREVPASPRVRPVPIVLLGSSMRGADVAAERGLPFAFAHHLGVAPPGAVVARYRASFRSSGVRSTPYAIVSVGVSCATAGRAAVLSPRSPALVGSPAAVAGALIELAASTGADELMVVPVESDGTARVRTLQLIADELDLPSHSVAGSGTGRDANRPRGEHAR